MLWAATTIGQHLTGDGLGNNYVYDLENKIKSSKRGSVYLRYTYDPFGERVRKDAGSAALEYYYFGGQLLATHDPSPGAPNGGWNDYIYAAGRLIAENAGTQSAVATFRLGDHLDSLEKTTDGAGNVLGSNNFSPYGQLVEGTAQSLIQATDIRALTARR